MGRSLEDLSDCHLVKDSVGEFDLWTSPTLQSKHSGRVTILGLARSLTSESLEDHFLRINYESTKEEVAELALDLTGRFVVLASLQEGLILLPDGIGSKRVFVSVEGEAASSSEVLLQRAGATAGPLSSSSQKLLNDSRLRQREYATFGLQSPFSGYRLLLPNRALNLSRGEISVCSPATRTRPVTIPEVARELRRNVRAQASLGSVNLGLTGGYDSRLLLAAFHAEGIDLSTYTFVSDNATKQADSNVARTIARSLGYEHREVLEPAPHDDVVRMLETTQPFVRKLPHVLSQLTWFYIHGRDGMITVSGVGGEVSRQRIGFVPRSIGRRATARVVLGPTPHEYDVFGFEQWWDDRFSGPEGRCELPATTLHHWEQRVGIWGAQFVGEKELFTDEVSGFASGRLQQSLLSFPYHRRSSLTSAVFWNLIEELSPDLARLGRPQAPFLLRRAYVATPLPLFLRSLRRGWGKS